MREEPSLNKLERQNLEKQDDDAIGSGGAMWGWIAGICILILIVFTLMGGRVGK